MPAILNLVGNLALGASIAFIARRSQSFRTELVAWPLLFALAFEGVIVTPIATYLFRFYPQWSMLYGFDPQVFPGVDRFIGLLSLAIVVLNFSAVLAGYYLVRIGLARERQWIWISPFATSGLVTLYVILFYAERIIYIGDFDSYSSSLAPFFLTTLPGCIGVLLYAFAGAFLLWVNARYSHRDPSFL